MELAWTSRGNKQAGRWGQLCRVTGNKQAVNRQVGRRQGDKKLVDWKREFGEQEKWEIWLEICMREKDKDRQRDSSFISIGMKQ